MMKLKASKKPPKVSCFQCFKLYYLAEGEPVPAKDELTFCSDTCTQMFYLHNSKQCFLKGCSKTMLKKEAIHIHGKWFCSDEHAEADPETKKLLDMIAKGLPEMPDEEEFMIKDEKSLR